VQARVAMHLGQPLGIDDDRLEGGPRVPLRGFDLQ
jgi:hypothetical protein